MSELKNTCKLLGIYYLLLLPGGVMNSEILGNGFPVRNLSSLYFLTLSICLILHYMNRVAARGAQKWMMLGIGGMFFLLLLLRGFKYTVLMEMRGAARYCWYLYYVPLQLIPTLFFFIVLLVYAKDQRAVLKRWWPIAVLAVVLAGMVMTNDLHQNCFHFREGMENWDSEYSYGWGQYLVWIFEYGLTLAAFLIMIIKCHISTSRKLAWILYLPTMIGITMIVLQITGRFPKIRGINIIQFPEAFCMMFAGILECSMQLGLIPSNEKHRKLFQISGLPMQILDRSGKVVYRTNAAPVLTKQQLLSPGGTRVDEHTVLRKTTIPGGFGIWLEDISELDNLNAELIEIGQSLEEEAQLNRLQNELKEKEAKIILRNILYDEIARCTCKQSHRIADIARRARNTADASVREREQKNIILFGTFLKRYANLMLLSQDNPMIASEELALSIAEMLRCLNQCKIPGELFGSISGKTKAEVLLAIFEAFEDLMERNMDSLNGIMVRLDDGENNIKCKLVLEKAFAGLSPTAEGVLRKEGIRFDMEKEDGNIYLCFLASKEVE